MIEIRNILHPTDFSPLSLHALRYAEFLAERTSATLHCFHVVADARQYYLADEMVLGTIDLQLDKLVAQATERMKEFVSEHLKNAERVEWEIRAGQPFVEIIRQAKSKDADLLVMGTHGRTGISHMLMGSVAEKVVRKSPCPVLTVRDPGQQFEMP
jgi:nucleotide-binding universal stress UspA family protein